MKNNLIYIVLISTIIFSCKKKYDTEILGPKVNTDYSLVEPFQLSVPEIDFAGNSNNRLNFDAKFSQKVKWKISIVGNESFAEKHIVGYSDTIPNDIIWNGSQDSLYYFRSNETCTITLSVDKSFNPTDVSKTLDNRGNIFIDEVILATDIVKIKTKRKAPASQIEVFPSYDTYINEPLALYLVDGRIGYDPEQRYNMIDKDPSIPYYGDGSDVSVDGYGFPKFIFEDPSNVPLSKGGGGLKGKRYYMLKGTDRTSKLFPGVTDYYIGRMASVVLQGADNYEGIDYVFGNHQFIDSIKKFPAESLYLNVFVYGNGDGSTINYTIKEDEGGYGSNIPNGQFQDADDESFEKAIKVNFFGWKLFSFKYSEFTPAPYKTAGDDVPGKGKKRGDLVFGTYSNKKQEPNKIIQVQFSLIASDKGKSGIAIIDNPVISWGGPLKY